jgi:drug/metabolite transporter (DMT)-like permease
MRNEPATHSRRTALVTLFAGGVAIGFAPILVHLCLNEIGPSTVAGFRLLFALPWLWLWMKYDLRQRPAQYFPRTLRDHLELSAGGLLFVADLAVWHWSLKYTSVTNSTLLTNGAPIFVVFGAWLLFGERITTSFIIGLVCALAGAVVLMSADLELSRQYFWGDILAIVGAFFYGAYQLMLKRLRQRFSTPVIMSWTGLTACPGFFLVGALSMEHQLPHSAKVWALLVALALICHLGGQTLIAYSFGHLPASFSSLSLLLQPVVASFLAWLLLSERLGWRQLAGGLLVLAGIALASRVLKSTNTESRA